VGLAVLCRPLKGRGRTGRGRREPGAFGNGRTDSAPTPDSSVHPGQFRPSGGLLGTRGDSLAPVPRNADEDWRGWRFGSASATQGTDTEVGTGSGHGRGVAPLGMALPVHQPGARCLGGGASVVTSFYRVPGCSDCQRRRGALLRSLSVLASVGVPVAPVPSSAAALAVAGAPRPVWPVRARPGGRRQRPHCPLVGAGASHATTTTRQRSCDRGELARPLRRRRDGWRQLRAVGPS
jgi:hypothetical protein